MTDSKQTAAKIQEQLYQFSGFYLQERTMREYPEKSAAHLLGYVSQVPDYILKKNDYYKNSYKVVTFFSTFFNLNKSNKFTKQ